MKRVAIFGAGAIVLASLAVLVAWATSPDPGFNPATFEAEPLVASVAGLDEATTLAQFAHKDGTVRTILVLGFTDETVTGIDLVALGGTVSDNPFAALASATDLPRSKKEAQALPQVNIPIDQLLATGSSGARHIGTGTNFPEHAQEASSGSVFQFPKFGSATPARTTVKHRPGILLDYEVELCMRFDRDIASLEDFDAATKGVFLCGDFTNRNALVELADADNLDSGSGFSDAKSGPDFFPTGPFLVIPKDREAFIRKVRMTTSLNGEARQDARGSEMTLSFRELVAKALDDMSQPRFLFNGGREFLAEPAHIGREMTIMSGTAEGVIFTSPTRADIIEAFVDYTFAGGPAASQGFMDIAKARFIANENATGHFLQPKDTVRHSSSSLGTIEVTVIE
ncbi:MAG: fumarylacetoacetate hydrolase family protein [Pseudomonadota bacterium]